MKPLLFTGISLINYDFFFSPFIGHRFRTTYDFGFVALDILYAYPEDGGTYMCRATNAAGQAVTSCSINVEGRLARAQRVHGCFAYVTVPKKVLPGGTPYN